MTPGDFERAYRHMFLPTFAGYTPAVIEAPNGDGKLDTRKRYAHLNKRTLASVADDGARYDLGELFSVYMHMASTYARIMNIPEAFAPSAEDSTLRLLEYPPGATGAEHTDFDLFTINLYRSHGDLIVPKTTIHYGEIAEIVSGGWLKATSHHVDAHPTQTQRSAVFFAMPPLSAVMPNGVVVRDWLAERKARSRVAY